MSLGGRRAGSLSVSASRVTSAVVGNEPSLRGLASPVRPQNGSPFCHVTAGDAPSPRTLHFVSLGGPTGWAFARGVLRDDLPNTGESGGAGASTR